MCYQNVVKWDKNSFLKSDENLTIYGFLFSSDNRLNLDHVQLSAIKITVSLYITHKTFSFIVQWTCKTNNVYM